MAPADRSNKSRQPGPGPRTDGARPGADLERLKKPTRPVSDTSVAGEEDPGAALDLVGVDAAGAPGAAGADGDRGPAPGI